MKNFLKLISYVIQPLLIPTYGLIILMQLSMYRYLGIYFQLLAVVGTLFFTTVLPAVIIFILIKKGVVSDVFMAKKEERTLPYIFSILSYVIWSYFLIHTLHFPIEFVLIAFGTIFSVILMIFINFRWKISAHLAGMGGLFGGVVAVSYMLSIFPLTLLVVLIILSGLLAVSRIVLKAHTIEQTLAGFCLGFACTFLPPLVYFLTFSSKLY